MKARWLVAKYMPDLRRREPDNVGVILLMDGRTHLRFLGQRDGRVDGRSVRWAGSVKNYKAWVDYWTHTAETTPLEALTSKLTTHVGDANYIVEVGGERIFGDRATPEEMLDYLYTTLIEPSSDRRSFSVGRLSENLFGRLSIHDQVQKDFKLDIDEDTIHFDYRYDNGQMNLMQGVSLVNADDRSWDNVHRVAYEFAKSARSTVPHQAIALVNPRDSDKDLDRQLRVLREHGRLWTCRTRSSRPTTFESSSISCQERLRHDRSGSARSRSPLRSRPKHHRSSCLRGFSGDSRFRAPRPRRPPFRSRHR